MLGLISEALRYIEEPPDLDALPLDDPQIYRLLQRGDTIGAFQVESRAQVQMLPRLKPERFEDIVVEVAIVRPGPIQGNAVHPYLRRRAGEEAVSYLHPCLEPPLRETLGVLLFQEQTIRVAMLAAGFSPGEADFFRRALSRNDDQAIHGVLHERFVRGAQTNHIDPDTAEAIFKQLAAFAGYGFCKSHAASFALIAYQSMYLKCYHPAALYCSLLNQQPMGFYSTEVIVNDMKRHGIALLPPDVSRSDFRYRLEATQDGKPALRMGLSTIHGLGERAWERIKKERERAPFADLSDFCIRVRLPQPMISDMIRAGSFDRFGARRDLLWELGRIDYRPEELPLEFPSTEVDLPALDELEATVWEYELLGLSPNGQIMRHHRAALLRMGILSTAEVKKQENGRVLQVAGMAVVKQRPYTAKGILFVSLEDECGLLDLVVKPNVYDRFRALIRDQSFLFVEGVVQQGSSAVSMLVMRALEWPRLQDQRATR
jgi:error-prone DNA polymerase